MSEGNCIQIDGRWYVLATSQRAEEQHQALKRDDIYALFNRLGDLAPLEGGDQGIYVNDTRYLSRLEMTIDGVRPLQLNSAVRDDGSVLAVELMNPDLQRDNDLVVPRGTVHILRRKLLWKDSCFEQLELTNYGSDPVSFELIVRIESDYADLFEIRGSTRERRGTYLPPERTRTSVALGYDGLDHARRRTVIRFDPAPTALEDDAARYEVTLAAGEQARLCWQIACEQPGRRSAPTLSYAQALEAHLASIERSVERHCRISTSNPLMDRWLQRSASDLRMLTTALPTGPYPYAGVPWFCTTFGRDALLTAHMCLWWQPELARGVLAFLAETQAKACDPATDAEPGKILHEARVGEMAATREVPFARYYGSVDSTPLFVMLAAAYWRRTGDLAFVRELWPHVKAAISWIDEYGDRDGDGFVEYARARDSGLIQQGWKDSHDSVFHADGTDVKAPVAICEVQGYAYAARLGAAQMAEALGDEVRASSWRGQAERLKRQFQEKFWCEELGMYALALDGDKMPCRVAASNAGHALWSGIAAPEHAARIAQRMVEPDMFSGWGVRTLATGQKRYNPMSYHNGSIWPHDNALICAGLARYGHMDAALKVFTAAFDCTLEFGGGRLPELFCGFPRRPDEGPTRYPVACSPQAWSSAALFGMLGGCLGVDADGCDGTLRLHLPRLPAFLDRMTINDLDVGGRRVDFVLTRHPHSTGVDVARRDDGLQVSVVV